MRVEMRMVEDNGKMSHQKVDETVQLKYQTAATLFIALSRGCSNTTTPTF
jgi:hypothetical protein